jgi:hypothetical protein
MTTEFVGKRGSDKPILVGKNFNPPPLHQTKIVNSRVLGT